jgi:hypothetical protein
LRAVVTGERTYILTLAAESDTPAKAEELWQANLTDISAILDSFRIAP